MWFIVMYRWRVLQRSLARSGVRVALLALTVGPAVVIALLAGRLAQESVPVSHAEALVMIGSSTSDSVPQVRLTYGDLKRLQDNDGVLKGVAGIQTTRYGGPAAQFDYFDGEFTIRLIGARVSPSFFEVLGAKPQQGQVFNRATVAAGGGQAAVLSDALWRDLFGGKQSIAGTRITLGGKSYQIVGVMPREFAGIEAEAVEVWIPWVGAPERPVAASEVCCLAVARLNPSVAPAVVSERLSQGYKLKRLVPIALREHLLGPRINLMRLLGLAVGLVLLLAVVALVHGQVAHTLSNGPDLAVLHACGASPLQVWVTIAAEEVLLALSAAPFMLGISWVTWLGIQPVIIPAASPGVPMGQLAWWVLVGGLGVSVATGCATATAVSHRLDISALVTRRTIAASAYDRLWRKALSFSVALVVVVMLMLTSTVLKGVLHANRFALGIDGRDIVVVGLRLSYDTYKTKEDVAAFETRALAALSTIPGVTSATLSGGVPVLSPGRVRVVSEGLSGRIRFNEYRIHPGYFEMLAIPIVEGRRFNDTEPEPVAIVSRECVAQITAGSPLGTTLSLTAPTRIVGVAGDVTSDLAVRSRCALYVPAFQETTWDSRFLLKVPVHRPSLNREIRQAIAAIDPRQPVARIAQLEQVLAKATAAQESVAAIVVGLAAVGWLIAVVWFNGVITKMTFDKRPEIGLRLAVGGSRSSVAWLVTWVEVWPLGLGTVVGVIVSGPMAQFTRHLVLAPDSSSLAASVAFAILGVSAMVAACLAPVWALTRRPPTDLLRN